MRGAGRRPGGRNQHDVRAVIESERATHLWKSDVVTDAQAETKSGRRNADELVPRRVAGAFVVRREHEKMRLAIARSYLAARIDEYLGIVNALAGAFRDTA